MWNVFESKCTQLKLSRKWSEASFLQRIERDVNLFEGRNYYYATQVPVNETEVTINWKRLYLFVNKRQITKLEANPMKH